MVIRPCFAAALALVWFTSGCNRADPHTVAIDASTPQRLASWRENHYERLPQQEWKEFADALQEIRLRVMADRQASGSAAVEDAMCSRVNGHSFSEVLIMGYETKLARLDPMHSELRKTLDQNAMLVTKPGDRQSAQYLEGLRARQAERMKKVDDEIDAAEKRLAELDASKWKAKSEERRAARAKEVAAPGMSREDARTQFTDLIQERRDAALLKYGAWPAKLDRDGASLPERERTDFMAKRAAAAQNGHVVVAICLRDRWWIYDEQPQTPNFPAAALANLTEADRAELNDKWTNLQAELWAREMASASP